ncbi:hypothetical protein GQ42DRAFT_161484 [Ramicandelaber brevisporus]|nr:hypothetical protein GQ42DRAFT_161484 [Ramicandelaber brevisporus]
MMNLLNLPRDILLYLTDFFKYNEAFPLLAVSSQFHDLFARAVWRIVDAKSFKLDPVTRSAAIARYGHLVRLVKHSKVPLLFPLNWHLKLPHVVRLGFIINNKLGTEFKRRIFVGIRSLVNLRLLTTYFEIEETPYTADGLASIILARHRDATKRKLAHVSLFVKNGYCSSPWDVCVRLFKKLSPLNIPRLVVDGYPVAAILPPSVSQCHALAPCLFTLALYVGHNAGLCASQMNGQYFSDKSVVFPRVENLSITLCCHRTEVFDPNCITPERFTSLQGLHIYETETCVHSIEDFRTACLAICTRHWLSLKQIVLDGMIDQTGLECILRANPHLRDFSLVYQHDYLAFHRNVKHIIDTTLNLYWFMQLLPKLESMSIVAPVTLRLDYKPQAVSGTNLGGHLTTIQIDGCSVSPIVLIWLLVLPKLKEVSLKNVVLIDPMSALRLIKRTHKHRIQKRSHRVVHLKFSIVNLNEECSQVLVEWVAALPTLQYVCDADAALTQRIQRRCPHLLFTDC